MFIIRFFLLSVNRIHTDIAFSFKIFYHIIIVHRKGENKMKKIISYAVFALIGGAYGAVSVFLAGLFLKNLGAVAQWIMKLLSLDSDIAHQVADVLLQLKDARIASPYLAFVLLFAFLGILILRLVKKTRTIVINIGAWLFLMIPSALLAAVFTHVNDILFLEMIKLLISIIPNL